MTSVDGAFGQDILQVVEAQAGGLRGWGPLTSEGI